MPSVKVLLKRNKQKTNGEYPIYIRIIAGRKTRFVSLGIYIQDKDWNESEKKIKPKHPNSSRINNLIAVRLKEAEALALELETDGKPISDVNLKERIKGKSPVSFLKFAEGKKDALLKSGKIRSYENYKRVINGLEDYLKGKDLAFNDITVSFLKKYEIYRLAIPNKINTVHTHLKMIRAIFNDAIEEDLVSREQYPFYTFKLKLEKTNKIRLNKSEIAQLNKLELKKDSTLYHCRNYFMFSFYCAGIRFGDFVQLIWDNIEGDSLIYQMDKTDSYMRSKLLPQAMKILDLYRTKKGGNKDFIFPILSPKYDYSDKVILFKQISSNNARINKDLKKLGTLAKINKPISFHVSRHSFADIARKGDMNIYDISKALRHSSLQITERYLADWDDEKLDKETNRIFKDI